MKKLFFLVFVGIIVLGCGDNETQQIKDVFNNFNEANLNTNGAKIYKYSSEEAHLYYEELLGNVLFADSISVVRLNIIDKTNVLSARAVLPDSVLLNISPEEFMIKMYTEINNMDEEKKRATKAMGIKNIRIENNKATAELTDRGRSLPEKVFVEFKKEEGVWKYNIISLFEFTKKQIHSVLYQSGMSENDFIELIFSDSDVQVKMVKELDAVWNPIKQ